MAVYHTEETIMDIMSYYKIGKVAHVDFTPINKKPGFGEYVDDVVKSAFVHFYNSHHYMSENESFWNHLSDCIDPYKLQISQSEYWLCLKNKNPVQRTMMNISQVVENGRYLENLVTEQAKNMEKQEEKLERLQQVVYQLLLRLYNQETQAGILNVNFAIMYPGDDNEPIDCKNTSVWQDSPTTRQGDENERRIQELEKEIQNMRNKLGLSEEHDKNRQHMNSPVNDNDNDSLSTHSSMPELVAYDSDDMSTNSLMYSLGIDKN
jgi:hypothetical protein